MLQKLTSADVLFTAYGPSGEGTQILPTMHVSADSLYLGPI